MLMSHSRHSNHVRNAYVNTEYEPQGRVLPYIGRRGIWAPGEGTSLHWQTWDMGSGGGYFPILSDGYLPTMRDGSEH